MTFMPLLMIISATACWTPTVGETTHRVRANLSIRRTTSALPWAVLSLSLNFIMERTRPSFSLLMKAFGYRPEEHQYLACHQKNFARVTFPPCYQAHSFTTPQRMRPFLGIS